MDSNCSNKSSDTKSDRDTIYRRLGVVSVAVLTVLT